MTDETREDIETLRAQLAAAEADEQAEDDTEDTDDLVDFDAYWREQDAKRKRKRVKLFGQVVELPRTLPLRFELEAKRLSKSDDLEDVKTLVSILFGDGALDRWVEAGVDGDQFAFLIAWAPQYIADDSTTFEQVEKQIAEAKDAGEA